MLERLLSSGWIGGVDYRVKFALFQLTNHSNGFDRSEIRRHLDGFARPHP